MSFPLILSTRGLHSITIYLFIYSCILFILISTAAQLNQTEQIAIVHEHYGKLNLKNSKAVFSLENLSGM